MFFSEGRITRHAISAQQQFTVGIVGFRMSQADCPFVPRNGFGRRQSAADQIHGLAVAEFGRAEQQALGFSGIMRHALALAVPQIEGETGIWVAQFSAAPQPINSGFVVF